MAMAMTMTTATTMPDMLSQPYDCFGGFMLTKIYNQKAKSSATCKKTRSELLIVSKDTESNTPNTIWVRCFG